MALAWRRFELPISPRKKLKAVSQLSHNRRMFLYSVSVLRGRRCVGSHALHVPCTMGAWHMATWARHACLASQLAHYLVDTVDSKLPTCLPSVSLKLRLGAAGLIKGGRARGADDHGEAANLVTYQPQAGRSPSLAEGLQQ